MSVTREAPTLQAEIAEVEALLQETLQDRSALAARLAGHTAAAGGKRLRPMLCLLSGGFGRPDRREQIIRAAAAMELIHLATLVHDDVVDHAATRRGRPTVSALWGNGLAVLTGDFLFAAAFELLHSAGDARLIQAVSRMVRELCAGAIEEAELMGTFAGADDQQPYYDRIYRKTAVFLETACLAGAMAAEAGPEAQRALAAFGRRTGMAFQVIDDLLDFTGDPARTGKPVGGDLRNGIATLPMMLGRRDPAAARLLARWFACPRAGDRAVRDLAAALEACGALTETERVARDLAGQGKRALQPLRGRGPVDALLALADRAVQRDC